MHEKGINTILTNVSKIGYKKFEEVSNNLPPN